ncbi:MAG: ribosome recycling factor [Nitrospinota bacterium]|nr:MAG: ribosome recycling factor [Nitrospinota bacterium]
MVEQVFKEVERKMRASVDTFRKELNGIRTGRASLSLLDGITVEYYGTPTPLNQVATLSIPESRLITIQPWDPSLIKEIEKAILRSDLGLNPSNDGKVIRIPIPPLTEERRKQLAKLVKKTAEEYRVAIRNIRREGNEQLKTMEKEKAISEDEHRRAMERVQKLTDEYIAKIDELSAQKEKEVMEG